MRDQEICIMGMGYVGLTLAAAMADRGFNVCGTEIDPRKLELIQSGRAHFHEAGLEASLRRSLKSGNLVFTGHPPRDRAFDVYVITVGTPLDKRKKPYMDMVQSVSREIAEHMRPGALVVLRSTVKLGTTRNVVKPILDATRKAYDLAFCPERTLEGNALEELTHLPQIVGGLTDAASDRSTNVFRRLTATILKVSNLETAEIIKLLDNSYRDLFFSFGNEVALMCEAVGISGREVINAANMGYSRTNIAKPGFVGGPCLEKDPHILIESLSGFDFVPELVQTGRLLNERLARHVFERAREAIPYPARPVITIMGLAFKGVPDTDDLRGSPALEMIARLKEGFPGATIRGQDYLVKPDAIAALGLQPVDDTEAFRGAHLVIVMNNNRGYRWLDVEERAKLMARPSLLCDCWAMFPESISLPDQVKLHVFGK